MEGDGIYFVWKFIFCLVGDRQVSTQRLLLPKSVVWHKVIVLANGVSMTRFYAPCHE